VAWKVYEEDVSLAIAGETKMKPEVKAGLRAEARLEGQAQEKAEKLCPRCG
jgi:hypothetical protein